MAARVGACLLPTSINLMLHGIIVSETMYNGCWRESAKPLLFYCGTMPVSLLVDQRKMIFYNKTLRSTNILLRVVCRLHLYEAQKLFSVYHVFPGYTGNVDIKRAVWARLASVF